LTDDKENMADFRPYLKRFFFFVQQPANDAVKAARSSSKSALAIKSEGPFSFEETGAFSLAREGLWARVEAFQINSRTGQHHGVSLPMILKSQTLSRGYSCW